MANAALLPLSDFAFSLPAVMGSNATPASSTNRIGVAVIVLGLGLYGYGGVLKNKAAAVARAASAEAGVDLPHSPGADAPQGPAP